MHRWKYVIRLFDMKLWEEVVNGLEPCSLKYTGIFYTCISVKMCQCSKFGCFPGCNHAYKMLMGETSGMQTSAFSAYK